MKFYYRLAIIILISNSSRAQNAISFDSLQLQYSAFTDQAVYFNSDKLVKSDYNGNIIWARSGGPINSPFKIKDDGIYIFYQHSLCKLDTSGNIVWSRDFIQPICAMGPNSNFIADLVINNNRIYILINQNSGSGGTSYPSLITLDTNGTLINSWCGEYYQNNSFLKGTECASGGVWISGVHGGTGFSVQVDSDGVVSPNITMNAFQKNQITLIKKTLQKNDLSHCYLVNGYTPGYEGYPYIYFESDDGNQQSYKCYTTPSMWPGIAISSAALDLNDNLYIFASGDSPQSILFKTDPIGNITIAKCWTNATLSNYQLDFSSGTNMIVRNDSLYLLCKIAGKTSILSLDTTLNSICFSPDSIVQIDDSPTISISYLNTWPVTHVSYSPLLTTVQNNLTPLTNAVRICQPTLISETSNNMHLEIYPNPASNQIQINVQKEIEEIKMYNLIGQDMKVYCTNTNQQLNIETGTLGNGLYFIVLRFSDGEVKKAVIVNNK